VISIPCTSCQKVLTVDEAFAGGVCRCQHCGTIQTVPAHLKQGSKDRSGPPAKTLYRHPSRGDSSVGTGLQNLTDQPDRAQVTKPRGRRAASPSDLPPEPFHWQLYAAAAGIVLLGILLVWLLLWHT